MSSKFIIEMNDFQQADFPPFITIKAGATTFASDSKDTHLLITLITLIR